MAYKEVDPQVWLPQTEGDIIEGVLVHVQDKVGVNESRLYSIETSKGVENVWGSTILDSRMDLVKIGDKVRITYKGLGEKKGGKNPPKIFKVEKDDLSEESDQPESE